MAEFYGGSEHSRRSEKIPEIELTESILVTGSLCLCGACRLVLDMSTHPTQCPATSCGATWKQIVLGNSAQPLKDAHLPTYGSDVIKTNRVPEDDLIHMVLGNRLVRDVVVKPDIL